MEPVRFLSSPEAQALRREAEAAWVLVGSVDGRRLKTVTSLVRAVLAAAHAREERVGGKGSALERLSALNWLPDGGFLLLVEHAVTLWQHSPALAQLLADCARLAREDAREPAAPWQVVFVMDP